LKSENLYRLGICLGEKRNAQLEEQKAGLEEERARLEEERDHLREKRQRLGAGLEDSIMKLETLLRERAE